MTTHFKILVIDDEWSVLKSVRIWLESAGFIVSTATSGFDGMQVAEAIKPDLVLLDISMPLMSGLAALRTLRANPVMKGVPIIIITGDSEMDGRRLSDKGASGILRKPFGRTELLNSINRIFRQHTQETDTHPAITDDHFTADDDRWMLLTTTIPSDGEHR